MLETTVGLGHNNPPNDAEILANKLVEEHAQTLQKAKDLIEASARIPESFDDEDTAQKAANFIKQVNALKKVLEDCRTKAKEPFLIQGRIVDTFFKAHDKSLDNAAAKAKAPLDAFTKAKVELERKRLAELEEQKRQEAAAMAAVAVAVSNTDVGAAEVAFEDALAAEIDAGKLALASQAKTGLAAVRSDMGVTASLRSTWVGEVEDVSKIDLETLRYLIPAAALQTALNAYIRSGGRELKGAKIWEKTETVVR